MSRCKSHSKLGRPPEDALSVERWDGKEWVPDDGEPGYAFSGHDARGVPYAWYTNCDCFFDSKCLNRLAMSHTCDRFGCANGRDLTQSSRVAPLRRR